MVNGLALPGDGTPDLVLLCVIALGMTGGPAWGLVAGFCAGLALDLAPPATVLVGQYALVLCLIGYCAGRLRFALRHSALLALAAAAVIATIGEAMAAVLTLALDEPEVTWATIAHVLPRSVLYDVVFSPLVLFCSVGLAVALGMSVDPVLDSPALESAGSAASVTVTATNPYGADRYGLNADSDPGLTGIAYRTGRLAGGGTELAGRGVPKIAFGGSLPGAGRAARERAARERAVPKIAFGTGALPGAGRAAGRAVPTISFGPSGPGFSGRRVQAGSRSRRAAPKFRPAVPARSATRPWLAGAAAGGTVALSVASGGPLRMSGSGPVGVGSLSLGPLGNGHRGIGVIRPGRKRKQPRFARAAASQQPAWSRQPKTPRIRGRRGVFRRLPWVTRAGGRSTVWRIGSTRTEGWR